MAAPTISRADRLQGMAISPYVILGTVVCAAGALSVASGMDVRWWLVLVALAAGWSSAWSP